MLFGITKFYSEITLNRSITTAFPRVGKSAKLMSQTDCFKQYFSAIINDNLENVLKIRISEIKNNVFTLSPRIQAQTN